MWEGAFLTWDVQVFASIFYPGNNNGCSLRVGVCKAMFTLSLFLTLADHRVSWFQLLHEILNLQSLDLCVYVLAGNASRLSLHVSGDGMRVLLVAITGQVFLWECIDVRDLTGVRDGIVEGHWAHIQPVEDSILPSSKDKEASHHTIFAKTEVCIMKILYIWHIVSYRPALHFWFLFYPFKKIYI